MTELTERQKAEQVMQRLHARSQGRLKGAQASPAARTHQPHQSQLSNGTVYLSGKTALLCPTQRAPSLLILVQKFATISTGSVLPVFHKYGVGTLQYCNFQQLQLLLDLKLNRDILNCKDMIPDGG